MLEYAYEAKASSLTRVYVICCLPNLVRECFFTSSDLYTTPLHSTNAEANAGIRWWRVWWRCRWPGSDANTTANTTAVTALTDTILANVCVYICKGSLGVRVELSWITKWFVYL